VGPGVALRLRECFVRRDVAMRVLVATTSGTGHIYPVVPIARALRDAGHEVVWATASASCSVVERFGFAARAAGMNGDDRLAQFIERHPEAFSFAPRERRAISFPGQFAELAAPVMAADLVAVFNEVRPELVVHEVAELGSVPLATIRELPCVAVGFSGVLPDTVLNGAVRAVAPLWDSLGCQVPPDLGLYAHPYLHPFPPMLGQRNSAPAVRDMRPVSADGDASSPDWLDQLGIERPLLYVTFGTEVGRLAPWRALLHGLAALNVDAVVTTGSSVDLSELINELPNLARERIHVRSYVPQSSVLARASVVVSHGGAGTVIAAGAAGLPQVIIPVAADQFDNADAFAAAGVAMILDVASADSDIVAAHIDRQITSSIVRARAGELAQQFAAMPHPDEVVAPITSS
jgi:UDP:flavonoid glycosyltransferase YjiC (YdhE family)